jgi:hypothetical protein
MFSNQKQNMRVSAIFILRLGKHYLSGNNDL